MRRGNSVFDHDEECYAVTTIGEGGSLLETAALPCRNSEPLLTGTARSFLITYHLYISLPPASSRGRNLKPGATGEKTGHSMTRRTSSIIGISP